MAESICKKCEKKKQSKTTKGGNTRTPQGWKTHPNGELWCDECWHGSFKLRAITFQVAGPIDAEWPDLRKALTGAWGRSTALANWAARELAKADCVRSAADAKIQPMPTIYLYGLWKDHFQRGEWTGSASSAQSIFRTVEAKYKATRFEIIWRGERSHPSFRYPYPFPIHNADWTASYREYIGKDGHHSRVPVIECNLGGSTWVLRLKGGAERIRQLRSFAKIVSGEAVQGELAIYRQGTFAGGNGIKESNGAAGSKQGTRVMVKIAAWLPRDENEGKRSGTLTVMTTNNSFLVALMPDDEQPWRLHADDVRGVIKQHAKLRQRLSDDTKAEQRRPPRQKARFLEMLAARCERCNNRVDTFVKESASWLVNYARRRKAETLTFDDATRGYFPSFPWERFRSQVAEKCDDAGIEFIHASGSVPKVGESEESVETIDA